MSTNLRPFKATSPSQIKSHDTCARKWWFEKILRLPSIEKDHLFYGTGLHSVAERFYLADDTGRDLETGKPVDLYPDGWDRIYDRAGNLAFVYSEEERELIKRQVDQAIANGTWSRKPGREIETERRQIPVGGTGIFITGIIDVANPLQHSIEDHKTSKNARYASTSRKLESGDSQLLIYSKFLLDQIRKSRGAEPEAIHVQHNVFLKDGTKEPYVASATYTVEQIEANWQRVIETTERMKETARATSPADIPDPEQGACFAYGGCDFLPLCGRRETHAKYTRRVTHLNRSRREAIERKARGEPEVSIFSRLMESKENDPTPAAAEHVAVNPPATEKEAPKVAEPEVAAEPERPMTPWADPKCLACVDNAVGGLSSKGKPCPLCLKSVDERNVPEDLRPEKYDLTVPFKYPRKPEPKPEPTPAKEEEPKKPAKAAAKEDAPKKRGAPRKGFTLLLGCVPTCGGTYVNGHKRLSELQAELAEANGQASYFDMDAFARRDTLCKVAPALADELGSKVIVFADLGSPDTRAFVDALQGLAGKAFSALR